MGDVARTRAGHAGVLLGLTMLVVMGTTGSTPAAAQPAEAHAAGLLELMNQERTSAGVDALQIDAAIGEAARLQAQEMAALGYLDHHSRAGLGLAERLAAFGVSYGMAGENIAHGFGDGVPGMVHGALMASDGHRANILEWRFRRVGIGVAETGGTWYFAVVFAD